MGDAGKLFDIQYFERRIGDCFAKQCLGVRAESRGDFFLTGIGIDKSNINTQLLHRHSEQVECTAVDGR